MKRAEAVKLTREIGGYYSPEKFIELLEALGLLNLEETPDPNQLFFSAMGDVPMNQRDVGKILAIINALGLKLVEK